MGEVAIFYLGLSVLNQMDNPTKVYLMAGTYWVGVV